MNAALTAQKPLKGAGLRILTESVSSPTLAAQIRDLLSRFPAAKWHQWDPASRDNARVGAKLAFGQFVDAQYRFDNADVILSLDADFLAADRAPALRRELCRAAASGRRRAHEPALRDRIDADVDRRARRPSPAAAAESDRGARARSSPPRWASQAGCGGRADRAPGATAGGSDKFIAAVAKDLQAHRGRSLVIAGEGQPAAVHALAHAMNEALGNVGKTVVYTQTGGSRADRPARVAARSRRRHEGRQGRSALILGGNPVYTAPADLQFADALAKVQLRVHLSLHDDETSALCHWHIPEAHFLEAWSDARAFDGTASIVQPLIAPLYGGKSAHEVLAALSDRPERAGATTSCASTGRLGQGRLRRVAPLAARRRDRRHGVRAEDCDGDQRRSPGSVRRRQPVAVGTGSKSSFRPTRRSSTAASPTTAGCRSCRSRSRRLTWDNAVIASPATADKLKASQSPSFQGGEHGQIISDVVELKYRGRSVKGALFAVAGHPDDCVTVHLGYGRTRAGRVGNRRRLRRQRDPHRRRAVVRRRRRGGARPANGTRSPARSITT